MDWSIRFQFFTLLLICLGAVNAVAQSPPTVDVIVEGLQATEKLFFENESVLIRYERTRSELINPPGPGSLAPAEWTLAFKGGKWFVKTRFTQPFETPDLKVPAEPQINLIKGPFILEWSQSNQSAVLANTELGRNSYLFWYYTRKMSLNAPKYIARSIGVEDKLHQMRKEVPDDVDLPFLPDFLLANRSKYRVLPQSENFQGSYCWVVEWPGMDRFLVDPTRGFAIPHRVFAWGPSQPKRLELTNSDYRQVKPGLWVPYAQVEVRYYNPRVENPTFANKAKHRSEYTLREIEFNTVPDALFDVVLPVGTRVFDVPREFRYAVDDQSADPFAVPIVQGLEQLNRPKRFWIFVNIVAVAILVLVVACRAWTVRRSCNSV